jgi:N utilization substance protein B
MEDDHKFWHDGEALLSEKVISRRVFRSLVFHFLYALDAYEYQTPLSLVITSFNEGYDLDITLDGDIALMVQDIADRREDLDTLIQPVLANWRLDRLGCVTLLILRMGLWELRYTKTPVNIVINEAVELAKCFAEKDAYRFVNGILDQLANNMHLSDAPAV